MRTNILSYILGSERRKKIVQTLWEYPTRLWSCSTLEEITKLPHATVFRTLQGLHYFGLLKSRKINKKDILYELVGDSPYIIELKKAFNFEEVSIRKIINPFLKKIKPKQICSLIIYGSAAKGELRPESDIDLLLILNKHQPEQEKDIYDLAAEVSARFNKTLSITIMDKQEIKKEKMGHFLKSVKANMEVLYGKKPF